MIVRNLDGESFSASFLFGTLAKELNRVPNEVKKNMTPALRLAAEPIRQDAKRRASWSRRIPSAMSISTRYSGKQAGVRISVSLRKAPHARAYEGITARARDGGRAGFRHPVWASGPRRTWAWAQTPFRPFLLPALEANRGKAEKQIATTVNSVLRQAGFR